MELAHIPHQFCGTGVHTSVGAARPGPRAPRARAWITDTTQRKARGGAGTHACCVETANSECLPWNSTIRGSPVNPIVTQMLSPMPHSFAGRAPSSAAGSLQVNENTEGRARAPGAAQGSRPTMLSGSGKSLWGWTLRLPGPRWCGPAPACVAKSRDAAGMSACATCQISHATYSTRFLDFFESFAAWPIFHDSFPASLRAFAAFLRSTARIMPTPRLKVRR